MDQKKKEEIKKALKKSLKLDIQLLEVRAAPGAMKQCEGY